MATTTPTRIRRRHARGWRAPEGAIYVAQGTAYANPYRALPDENGWRVVYDHGAVVGTFPAEKEARRYATDAYRTHLRHHPELVAAARQELAGRVLICWCKLPNPDEADYCHAAVLAVVANGGEL